MRDLSSLTALVVNDDGIAAPGIAVLEEVARKLFKDVYVVAPALNNSGAGHSFTLTRPLRVREHGPHRYAVDGTPTDCVMLGLQSIIPDGRVDIVLSGVNNGANMGDDVTYSGTIGAAMEARLLGFEAIAFSQASLDQSKTHWACAREHLPEMLGRMLDIELPSNVLMNVNFPNCLPDQTQGFRFTSQGRQKAADQIITRPDPRGNYYHWIGEMVQHADIDPASDVAAVREKCISATPIRADLTDYAMLDRLRSGG